MPSQCVESQSFTTPPVYSPGKLGIKTKTCSITNNTTELGEFEKLIGPKRPTSSKKSADGVVGMCLCKWWWRGGVIIIFKLLFWGYFFFTKNKLIKPIRFASESKYWCHLSFGVKSRLFEEQILFVDDAFGPYLR